MCPTSRADSPRQPAALTLMKINSKQVLPIRTRVDDEEEEDEDWQDWKKNEIKFTLDDDKRSRRATD